MVAAVVTTAKVLPTVGMTTIIVVVQVGSPEKVENHILASLKHQVNTLKFIMEPKRGIEPPFSDYETDVIAAIRLGRYLK